MNRAQIDRLVAGVPARLDASQHRRVETYAAAAHRCSERIGALRVELDRALRALDDSDDPGPQPFGEGPS